MTNEHLLIEHSPRLSGTAELTGAKNATLVIMASLILTSGKSRLSNIPFSEDVFQMITLLEKLGAHVTSDQEHHTIEVDTTGITTYQVPPEIMKKMRASILVMGPLLARFGKAEIAVPGGCALGARPIDYHLKAFTQMGASINHQGEFLTAAAEKLVAHKFILEYPSVGATENIMMAATLTPGTTSIVNASLEPEVLDLIKILTAMGAHISILPPATILIEGVTSLNPVNHEIIYDRLEAGSLLLAAAITGGEIHLPQAPAELLELFLLKLEEMGHQITTGQNGRGVSLKATDNPHAVSFKTMPYPGFPTDLQAPMMVALCLASGTSVIHETVFENRLVHVRELRKMGALISTDGTSATVTGVDDLYGAQLIAPDIRAAYGLVLAGLAAQGSTTLTGIHHLRRGYEHIIDKLIKLGAKISLMPALTAPYSHGTFASNVPDSSSANVHEQER